MLKMPLNFRYSKKWNNVEDILMTFRKYLERYGRNYFFNFINILNIMIIIQKQQINMIL